MDTPEEVKEESTKKKKLREYKPNPFLTPLSVVIAGALIAGAIIYNGRVGTTIASSSTLGTSTTSTPQTVTVSLAHIDAQGNKNADVAMVEFGDYQCPYCQLQYNSAMPQVETNYIQNNKVLFVFKDFPLTTIHPNAMPGAEGARCAGDQGKYWDMYNKLYSTNQETNDQTQIEGYAKDLNLNTTQFNNCLEGAKYYNTILAEEAEGTKLGFTGTPTTVIGRIDHKKNTITGQVIAGAASYETIKQAIDAALKG